jgi:colicin import membrane protein
MSDLLREYWKSLLGAVLVHALIAALLFVAVNFSHQPKIAGQLAIQAVLTSAPSNRNAERERQEREAAATAEQEKLKEQEQAKAEQQKQEQAQKANQEKAKQEASRKEQEHQLAVEAEQAEIRKQADVKRQQQADQLKKQQADQQQKAEAERQQKAAADKQKLADIQRKQKEEADSREKTAREAELKRQLAEEEGRSNAVDSGALAQYMSILQQRINNNWNRPLSATSGVQCDIKISQTSNGTVVSAQVTQCNGDPALKQSIEQAVYKSSPLPLPQDSRLFERNLLFRFKPD